MQHNTNAFADSNLTNCRKFYGQKRPATATTTSSPNTPTPSCSSFKNKRAATAGHKMSGAQCKNFRSKKKHYKTESVIASLNEDENSDFGSDTETE
jgi:hypothetical protein